MKKLLAVAFATFLTLSAYAQNTKVENNTQFHSVELVRGDSTFLAIKAIAQKRLSQFIDSLARHGKDISNYTFQVKSDFVEKGVHEHMWSQVFIYKNGSFEGIFIDSPFDLKNIKTGDKVTIKKTDVEDWTIENIRTKKETGYFSKKYLKSKG